MGNGTQNFQHGGMPSGTPNEEHDLNHDAYPEHWQEQLQMAAAWRYGAGPHCHAKKPGVTAFTISGKTTASPAEEESPNDGENVESSRAAIAEEQRQDWDSLDLSGQLLPVIAPRLFDCYTFLTKLYMDSNKLGRLPPGISQLRNLTHLQASANQVRELPDTIGMLTKLRELLLFDNEIHTLPTAIGHLYKLEMLGLDGNPLDPEIREALREKGTKVLIEEIRDRAEGSLLDYDEG